jgi:tetratricopeptide (TPR) repeat protein
MVVGHTVTAGVIEPRFGGKHISIDAGMLELYQGGHRVALEIEGDSLRAIHPDGKVPLPDHLDETNVFDYLREVAVVDPENVTVYSRLADEYLRRKDWIAARAVLEQLFRIPKPVPFTYRKELAETYTQLGEAEKAEAQNLAYLEGLKQVAESRPDNVHIINLLARFSLEKHLAMESAEKLLSKAIEKQPQNPSLLVTLGRIQLDGARFQQAVETLEKAVAVSPPGYETLYYLGLAYLGIGERQRARDAFEKAIEREPSRSEAREELRKLGISGSDSRPDPQAGIPLPAALR